MPSCLCNQTFIQKHSISAAGVQKSIWFILSKVLILCYTMPNFSTLGQSRDDRSPSCFGKNIYFIISMLVYYEPAVHGFSPDVVLKLNYHVWIIMCNLKRVRKMENKETYIVQNEIRVKNLLSDMYNSESSLLSSISRRKERLDELKKEIAEMENDYQRQNNLRLDLTSKFEELQKSKSSKWEDFKKEYEMVLDFAEGDKNSFVQRAEEFMEELNGKIQDLEEKVRESSADAKQKSKEVLDELNQRKEALQDRLDEAKSDTGEVWKDIKQWFIERAKSVRSLF